MAWATPIVADSRSETTNDDEYTLIATAPLLTGRLYILGVKLSETGGSVDESFTPTGGVTWTQISAGESSSDTLGLEAFWGIGDADESVDIVSDTLSTTHEGHASVLIEIASGFDPADPISHYDGISSGTNATANTYSVTLDPAPASDDAVIALFAMNVNGESVTHGGTNYVGLADPGATASLRHGNPSSQISASYAITAPGDTPTAAWTSNTRRRALAIVLNPAPVTPPAITSRMTMMGV